MGIDQFDPIRVKDQLGTPDTIGIYPVQSTETVIIEEQATALQTAAIGTGTGASLWDVGYWDVAYWDYTPGAHPYYAITNPNNDFRERFLFSRFIGTGSGCTTNYTTNISTLSGNGAFLEIISAYYDSTSTAAVTTAQLSKRLTAGSTTDQLSHDGGATWTTATSGTAIAFGTSGYDLRVRMYGGSGSGWPTAWGTWGSAGGATITYVNVVYTTN